MTWGKNNGIPQEVKLCIGCQVVVTSNIDQDRGIINGTRGVITELGASPTIQLMDGTSVQISSRKVKDDTETLELETMPLMYGWAVTIHKSQGMTLDAAEMDLGNSIFAPGQAYTALSRVRSLKYVRITNVSPRSFIVDKYVKKFYAM
jgi:ATP-dependent exoDNAse (exonuclease V) alpha subunit